METILIVLRYPTIKQKPELRSNGMVIPGFSDFSFFYLYGMTEHGNSFLKSIISSYDYPCFLRYLILKLEQLRQPATKYIETTTFCKGFLFLHPPALRSMLIGLQITPRPCRGQINDPQQ